MLAASARPLAAGPDLNAPRSRPFTPSGDFGLATYRGTGDSGREDTNLVGTPQYLSPELLSQRGYCFQSDVWCVDLPPLRGVRGVCGCSMRGGLAPRTAAAA